MSTDGIFCPNDHYVCRNDLIPYLAENVFPNIYRLRANRCAIVCPVHNCNCNYNSIILFSMMPPRERSRYLSILNDTVVAADKSIQKASHSFDTEGSVRKSYHGNDVNLLKSAILDVMTLRCPQCKTTVDPYPDACSAVMCLNCGNHYCNYCFASFATGALDKDRAAAHSHAAVHNDSDRYVTPQPQTFPSLPPSLYYSTTLYSLTHTRIRYDDCTDPRAETLFCRRRLSRKDTESTKVCRCAVIAVQTSTRFALS